MAYTEKISPLDRLGRSIDVNLMSLKQHAQYLASDIEKLETNLTLMHQALVMQDIAISKLKSEAESTQARLHRLETMAKYE